MARVQFNLLPDVKIEYDRILRSQKKITSIATLVSAIIVGVFLVTFLSVNGLQSKLVSNADKDITKYGNQLKSVPDLSKILTIQNQLASLPSLRNKTHATSRFFDYLPKLVPPNAGISKLTLDNTTNAIAITGTANSIETINTFVDTLKFTTFSVGTAKQNNAAFTTVVLASANRDSKNASFTINANYNPQLFDASQQVTLNVPQQLTTRSITSAPALFTGQPTPVIPTTPTSTSGGSQ